MLNLQLAVLQAEPAFERLRDQVKEIAGLLEEKASIPMVQEQMPLIQELQTDEWWQDVTAPMLETARKRLRVAGQADREGAAASRLHRLRGRDRRARRTVELAGLRRGRTTSSGSGRRRGRSCGSTRTTSRSTSCGRTSR